MTHPKHNLSRVCIRAPVYCRVRQDFTKFEIKNGINILVKMGGQMNTVVMQRNDLQKKEHHFPSTTYD
jgi:hypothetical protein